MRCIYELFKLILQYEYIPTMFKTGVIIPIPKGDKDKTLLDNYRGITLMSVIVKVFEKCIM